MTDKSPSELDGKGGLETGNRDEDRHRKLLIIGNSAGDGDDGDLPNVTEKPYVDATSSRDTQCGIGSCRPKFARPLGTIWVFTAVMSIGTVIENMNFSYYSAVITQIERRFGLSR